MQSSFLLQLLILLVVANGIAVVAKKLFGGAFARPLDGGALFVDGQPLFGPSKTIRGIVVSILATSICAVSGRSEALRRVEHRARLIVVER